MSKPIYEFNLKTESQTTVVPASLNGSVYFYDTGVELNGQPVYNDASDTFALWNDASGKLLTAVAGVDQGLTNYFAGVPVATSNVIVSGAGDATKNGLYEFDSVENDRAYYVKPSAPTAILIYSAISNLWGIRTFDDPVKYTAPTTDYFPPDQGWTSVDVADDPPPQIRFIETSDTEFYGVGTFSGTLTASELLISDAWCRAEKVVFDSLVAFTQSKADVNAFRGRFPSNADNNDKFTNVWKIDSGGTAGAFPIERTYGEDGNWCNFLVPAEIEGYFKTRCIAMNFASTVLAWLKSTNNFAQTGIVTWCMLTGLPESPEPEVIISNVHWRVTIPLQILFLTEGTH